MSYTPEDKEYMESVKESDLHSTISLLEDQIKQIEFDMKMIQNDPNNQASAMEVDEERDINDDQARALKRRKTSSISHNDISATLTPWENASGHTWDLTFQKGKVSINTNIHNYSQLLDSLHTMMGAVTLASEIPSAIKTVVQQNTLLGILNSLVRKKYGKSHCKFVAKSAHVFIAPPEHANKNAMMVVQSSDSLRGTTWKLIKAYLQCQHLRQLAIHPYTFFNMFSSSNEVESAVVMAFAANICTLRCKHVAVCLSSISLLEFGKFYYKRAKQLIADSFDSIDLSTYTSYTLLAIYSITFTLAHDMNTYIDMSDRLSHLLEGKYCHILKSQDANKYERGEAIHFFRLRNHFRRVLTRNAVSIMVNRKVRTDNLPFCTLMHFGEGRWEAAEDDSPIEKKYLRMENYILELQRMDQLASRHVKSSDIQNVVGLIGHCIEMSMRHWYNHVLPPEFKLSLPLFDADIDANVYYATLERECAENPIPALTTIKLYEEFIVIGQAYLPKQTSDKSLEELLLDYTHSYKQAEAYWDSSQKLYEKECEIDIVATGRLDRVSSDIDELLDFEGTKSEFLSRLCHMLEYTEAGVSTGIIMTSLTAAFNAVRITKYLRSRTDDCEFDVNILMNAWRFLLNVCKLQHLMPPIVQALMPRIKDKLNTISAIFEEELVTQPFQGKIENYMATMSYESGVPHVVEDDYEWVACPDA
ncbi:hypothetical protein K501DRAFT_243272 [Backusella circina FSU 941]|nr:hypothetical protein K501DRAFT_243272 [Backusella circina FSU 941]